VRLILILILDGLSLCKLGGYLEIRNQGSDRSRLRRMRIGFLAPRYTLRGADVVLWAFAYFSDGVGSMGHESWVFVYDDDSDADPNIHEPQNREEAVRPFEHFKDKGRLIHVSGSGEPLECALREHGIEVCYMYLAGFEDEKRLLPKGFPVVTHCIFNGMVELGDCHTVISTSVPHNPANGKTVVLPNILLIMNHDESFRKTFNIPEDAVVFGRYGGYMTFSIPWVKEAVVEFAKSHPEVWFVFMNTMPFSDMAEIRNILYVKGTSDLSLKRAFINTCDAMLHARIDGETFGCAIGEFAVCGKPIITSPCIHRSFGYAADGHLDILGGRACVYSDRQALTAWLSAFAEKQVHVDMKDNGYIEFVPDKVMPIFDRCVRVAKENFDSK